MSAKRRGGGNTLTANVVKVKVEKPEKNIYYSVECPQEYRQKVVFSMPSLRVALNVWLGFNRTESEANAIRFQPETVSLPRFLSLGSGSFCYSPPYSSSLQDEIKKKNPIPPSNIICSSRLTHLYQGYLRTQICSFNQLYAY